MWPPELRAPTQGRPYGLQGRTGIFIGDTGREKKFKIRCFHARKLLKTPGAAFLQFPIFSHDHGVNGDARRSLTPL